ncbi:MAG: B12-binding domain-containing radical SAM protein [Chloroflexi bacterium]|nr:B12-binding domain-containing radical SAM protein [Chloroflexota bacterium]
MRARLVLVNSNLTYEAVSNPNQVMNFPMAILVVGALAERAGYDVTFIDPQVDFKTGKLSLDDSFLDRVTETILKEDSDLYGFSCRCDAIPTALNIVRRLKKIRPDAKILLGGTQATFADMEIMKHFPEVDFILRGEVENSLPEFLACFKADGDFSGVPGLTYREGDRINRTPDVCYRENIDDIPMAYHLMKRKVEENRVIFVPIGRGCPNNCTYCAVPAFNRQDLRLKSPRKIVEEVNYFGERFKTSRFLLGHDHFMAKREWVLELCDELSRNERKITFFSMGHIVNADEELLGKLAGVGCQVLQFGLESMSENTQQKIEKNLDLKRVFPVLQLCYKYGILAALSVIVGLPEDKEEDLDETLAFLLKAKQLPTTLPEVRLLAPMAGTPAFKEYAKNISVLKYTGVFPAMLDTPTVILKDNRDLIRRYPTVFTSHFTLKPRYLPLSLVLEVSRSFQSLVYSFPVSALMALTDLKWGTCRMLRELKKWHRKTTGKKTKYLLFSRGELGDVFPKFLEDAYDKKGISFYVTSKMLKAEKRNVDAQAAYLNKLVEQDGAEIKNLFRRESLYGGLNIFNY